MKWLICYDISDDARRAAMFKQLGEHAIALQKSVFEFEGGSDDVKWLVANLVPMIDQPDSLMAIPLKDLGQQLGLNHQELKGIFLL